MNYISPEAVLYVSDPAFLWRKPALTYVQQVYSSSGGLYLHDIRIGPYFKNYEAMNGGNC